MCTLTVYRENESQEKALKAVFEALQVHYEEEGNGMDETERIMQNGYLVEKLEQSRQGMLEGKARK